MGIEREIPLAEVILESSLEYLTIQSMMLKTEVNHHAFMQIQLMVNENLTESELYRIKGQNVTLKLKDGTILFCGICMTCGLNAKASYKEVTLMAKSLSIKADSEKKDRTFQNPGKTLGEVLDQLVSPYGGDVKISKDNVINYVISQKQETDWEFLLRIANTNGNPVFVECRAQSPIIYVGNNPLSYQIMPFSVLRGQKKSLSDFVSSEANKLQNEGSFQFTKYAYETRRVTIIAGDMVEDSIVTSTCLFSDKGVLINLVDLQNSTSVAMPYQTQMQEVFSSRILTGTIINVSSTTIKVKFDVDSQQSVGEAVEIPYESVLSNSFYNMPDMGDKVFVYCDNLGHTICLGSKRTDTADSHFEKPEEKAFGALDNLVHFTKNDINFTATRKAYTDGDTSNQVSLLIEDQNGVTMRANSTIKIASNDEILLAASKKKIDAIETEKISLYDAYEGFRLAGDGLYKSLGGMSEAEIEAAESKKRWSLFGSDVGESFINGGKAMIFYDWWPRDKSPHMNDEIEVNQTGQIYIYAYDISFEVGNAYIHMGVDSPSELYIYAKVFGWVGSNPTDGYPQKADELRDAWEIGMDILCAGLAIAGTVLAIVATGGALAVAAVAVLAVSATIALARGDYFGAVVNAIGAFGQAIKGLHAFTNTVNAVKGLTVVQRLSQFAEAHKKLIAALVLVYKAGQYVYKLSSDYKQLLSRLAQHDSFWGKAGEWVVFLLNTTDGSIGLGNDVKENVSKIRGTDTPTPDSTNTNENGDTTHVGDPVDIVTGALEIKNTDVVVKNISSDFSITRTYRSIHQNENQMLGNRWLLNIETSLCISQQKIDVFLPDIHKESFVRTEFGWKNAKEGKEKYKLTETQEGYCVSNALSKQTYYYNQNGKITSIVDNNGNRTIFEYEEQVLCAIQLASGVRLTLAYEKNKLSTITDNIGRVVQYKYENELLKSVTLANDGTVSYAYTPEGCLESITDQNGKCYVKSSYDRKGRVVRQNMSNGEEYIYLYNDADKINTFITTSKDSSIKYYYNREHHVTCIEYDDGTTFEKKYDANEKVIEEKDRNNHYTYRTFDECGRLLSETFPMGLKAEYTYDENGNILSRTDNAGHKNLYTYDANSNLVQKENFIDEVSSSVYSYVYDSKGRLLELCDGNGNHKKWSYETDFNVPTQFIGAENETISYEYDAAGRNMTRSDDLRVLRFGYNNLDYQTMITDAQGHTTRYTYDRVCNLTKVVLPNEYALSGTSGNGISYEYDDMNHLLRTIDEEGNTVAVDVDCAGNVLKEINPNTYKEDDQSGEGIQYEYDKDGRRVRIIYPNGGIEYIKYDANGNIIKKIQPSEYATDKEEGAGYTYEYDKANRLIQITNPLNVVEKRYVYDLCGKITKLIDSKGYMTADTDEERIGTLYTYNLAGSVTSKRVPVKKNEDGTYAYTLTCFMYDKVGNLILEKRYLDYQTISSQAGRVHTIKREYDKSNRLINVSDCTGAAMQYQYNNQGFLVQEKIRISQDLYKVKNYVYDSCGKVEAVLESADKKGCGKTYAKTKYLYDANGNLVKIISPLGNEVTREYDKAGRLISETHDEKNGKIHNKFQYQYDKAGNLVQIIDGDGKQSFEYDLLNRETKYINKSKGTTYKEYDLNGHITKVVLPNAYKKAGVDAYGKQYEYDVLGRMIQVRNEDAEHVINLSYSDAGELQNELYADGASLQYEYDFGGRRSKFVTAENSSQQFEYDASGNIIGVIDGNNHKTEYELDKWGRIVCIQKPDDSIEKYAYDLFGNITSATDGNGNKVTYSYNELNKLAGRTDAKGLVEQYYYDLEGRVSSYENRNGNKTDYRYNMYGSVTSKQNAAHNLQETYGYYPNGKLEYAIASGMRYDYFYDPNGMLKAKKASGRSLVEYDYDLEGNKISQTDITGKQMQYVYNVQNQLSEVWDQGSKLASYKYTAVGQIAELSMGNNLSTQYAYDKDGNIIAQKSIMGSQILGDYCYSYDGNGNRLSKQNGQFIENYQYDAVNRLVQIENPNSIQKLFYDRAGNRIRYTSQNMSKNYTYDENNRLMQMSIQTEFLEQGMSQNQDDIAKQSSIICYSYDNQGNMLKDDKACYQYDAFERMIQVNSAGNMQTNRYDAEGLRYEVEENGNLVKFLFSGRNVIAEKAADNTILRYLRGHELLAVDRDDMQTYLNYVSDENGSITHLVSEKEDKIYNEYQYDAFGNFTMQNETISNRFGYTGQQYDSLTGQYYLRARYYNPVIGRFLQEDTYYGDGLNLYAYCGNNPVTYYDPTGHDSQTHHNASSNPLEDSVIHSTDWGDPDFADQYAQHVQDMNAEQSGSNNSSSNSGDSSGSSGNHNGDSSNNSGSNNHNSNGNADPGMTAAGAAGAATNHSDPNSNGSNGNGSNGNGSNGNGSNGNGSNGNGSNGNGSNGNGTNGNGSNGNDSGHTNSGDSNSNQSNRSNNNPEPDTPNNHPSQGGSGSNDIPSSLVNGSSMTTSRALDIASEFLGEGYTEPNPGSGRFVSADGTRVFRMGDNDILGRHGGGRHVNFEILAPNPNKPGKMQVVTDIHIYLED